MSDERATPTPTWYDVLGVSRDAGPDEIKAAWRRATDAFEPGSGSGQFRMFNDAADVLLDPERRRAYDASLEPESPPDQAEPLPPAPVPERADSAGQSDEQVAATGSGERVARRRGVWGVVLGTLGALSLLTLSVLAVLTIALVAGTTVAGVKVHQEAEVIESRSDAPAAAERAATAILSYDYRDLAADRKRAGSYLTPSYRKKYDETFTLLEKQKDGSPGAAVQTKTVVKADALGSGVVDAEDGKARVLVYVNQVSERPGAEPQVFQNRVTMTMERDGDRWLVDDLKSY